MSVLVANMLHTELWAERARQFVTLEYGFVLRALLASTVVGVCCGVVGVFLVLRRLSLLGDAAGHATLPGVAMAFLITGTKSLPILLAGALSTSTAAALLTGWLGRQDRTREDAAVGISLAGFFGIGVLLLSIVQRSTTGAQAGINTFLFGNATGISPEQLVLLFITSCAVLIAVALLQRALAIQTFDPSFADAVGIRSGVFDTIFILLLSVSVVVAIECVGVVLVSAMLIIPASTALLFSRNLLNACIVSGVLGALSGVVGVFLSSLQEGFSSGPMMVLVATFIFLCALTFRRLSRVFSHRERAA